MPHVAAADVVAALVVLVAVEPDVFVAATVSSVQPHNQCTVRERRTGDDGLAGDLARSRCVLVRLVQAIELGDGLDRPSRSDGVRPGVHERVNGIVAELVLEDDKTFSFITLEPAGHVGDGLVAGGTAW